MSRRWLLALVLLFLLIASNLVVRRVLRSLEPSDSGGGGATVREAAPER